MKVLTVVLGSLLSTYTYAETSCYGKETGFNRSKIEWMDRFKHCLKGDVISVYAASQIKIPPRSPRISFSDVHYFSLRADEVKVYCSFDHPIIFVGETIVENDDFSISVRWFDCLYIGNERESRSPE